MASNITEDLREAEELLATAKRTCNKRLLQDHVKSLKEQLERAEPAEPAPTPAPTPAPVRLSSPPATDDTSLVWSEIPSFAWDQGEYGSKWVTVYCTNSLEGVGEVKKDVTCDFTKDSFDLKVPGLNGKNYRLLKLNLDKDIIPEESTFKVKKNGVNVKLKKVKGEYSYENWTDLTSKKDKAKKEAQKSDPMGGIMDMMKDMYDNGDDQMKKTIGEAMMKANTGQKDDMGMPSMDP